MLNNWVNTYYTNYEMGRLYSKNQADENKYIKKCFVVYIKIIIIDNNRQKWIIKMEKFIK